MKRSLRYALVAVSLLAVVAMAPAQDSPKISLSETIDQHGTFTPVVAGTLREFQDVLGYPGLNFYLKGLVQPVGAFKLGTALTFDLHKHVPLAKGFTPILDFSVGPWINYGTGAGKMSGGLYFAIGARF